MPSCASAGALSLWAQRRNQRQLQISPLTSCCGCGTISMWKRETSIGMDIHFENGSVVVSSTKFCSGGDSQVEPLTSLCVHSVNNRGLDRGTHSMLYS